MVSVNTLCKNILNVKNAVIEAALTLKLLYLLLEH